jgi:aspartate carbamoyltransferase catalytic subunit
MYVGKDLLGLKHLSKEEILFLLDRAKEFFPLVSGENKKTSVLSGRSVFLTFFENSTRTSSSFDHAVKILGGTSVSLSVSQSSVKKGESLVDTVKNLEAMGADAIIMRHPMAGAPHLAAKNLDISVINAGDGQNEHPTQALLDIFQMRRVFGDELKGLKVFLCGDITHSRVARSNIWALGKLGVRTAVFGPPTLLPAGIEELCEVAGSVADGVSGADVIMGLRLQSERQTKGIIPGIKEYSEFFGLNERSLRGMKKGAVIMHPGPVNRGAELDSSICDGGSSVVLRQVTAGVAVRMAVLDALLNKVTTE